jgi:hypothetical protein
MGSEELLRRLLALKRFRPAAIDRMTFDEALIVLALYEDEP